VALEGDGSAKRIVLRGESLERVVGVSHGFAAGVEGKEGEAGDTGGRSGLGDVDAIESGAGIGATGTVDGGNNHRLVALGALGVDADEECALEGFVESAALVRTSTSVVAVDANDEARGGAEVAADNVLKSRGERL
jgi:hypothetical protein